MIADPFDDKYEHLVHLTDQILRDLARNDAAQRDYRKMAVEILWTRKSPYVKHSDLREFVSELEAEFEGIQFEFPAPEIVPAPAMRSSITTSTMFGQEETIDNLGGDDEVAEADNNETVPEEVPEPVQIMDKPAESVPTTKRRSGAKKNADS